MPMKFKTIEWRGDRVRILDQRRLPHEVRYLDCKDASQVAMAIRSMAIRGAPAIGVAAAMGIALGAKRVRTKRPETFRDAVGKICEELAGTRPTAVNLFWAVDRMKNILDAVQPLDVEETKDRLRREASRILEEDVEINLRIGENGKVLINNGDKVLTHCNAGALATAGHGTALGVIQSAWNGGKRFHVLVDETRPLFQGARLTAWELSQEKIPFTVLTDSMAGWMMKNGEVSLVLVGADRICRNGDTANKIGTYGLAVLANYHRIPFYVAAPTSTLDSSLACGTEVPIEERSSREVTHPGGKPITPEGVRVRNPAFDVTPHSLIHAIITEKKIVRKPFKKELVRMISG
jgi:methylthioribose-1-phosphate isomerase